MTDETDYDSLPEHIKARVVPRSKMGEYEKPEPQEQPSKQVVAHLGTTSPDGVEGLGLIVMNEKLPITERRKAMEAIAAYQHSKRASITVVQRTEFDVSELLQELRTLRSMKVIDNAS